MQEIELILTYPPSINKYYVKTRNGIFIGKAGKLYREEVAEAVQQQIGKGQRISEGVSLTAIVYPPDRRKRDLDNILKALLDSLTKSGIWEDDSLVAQLLVFRGATVAEGSIRLLISEAAPILPVGVRFDMLR